MTRAYHKVLQDGIWPLDVDIRASREMGSLLQEYAFAAKNLADVYCYFLRYLSDMLHGVTDDLKGAPTSF